MLAINTARPATCQVMLQRFGFPHALKRIPLDRLDQLDDFEGFLTVLLNPPCQVFERGGIKFQASGGLHRRGFPPAAPGLRGAAVSWSRSAAGRPSPALRRFPARGQWAR